MGAADRIEGMIMTVLLVTAFIAIIAWVF